MSLLLMFMLAVLDCNTSMNSLNYQKYVKLVSIDFKHSSYNSIVQKSPEEMNK